MSTLAVVGFASLSGYLSLLAATEARPYATRLLNWYGRIFEPLVMVERGGYVPSRHEQRRMAVGAAILGFSVGWAIFGMEAALAVTPLCAVVAWRLPAIRGTRYRRRFERGIPEAAYAMADGLAAGHSLRATLTTLPDHLNGPAAGEFRSLACELELGAPLKTALGHLVSRTGSIRAESVAAALLAGARSGGDLAGLMRRLAAASELRLQSIDDAHSATSQARLTAGMVAVMPIAGAAFVELMNPGAIFDVLRSPIALMLVMASLGLQLAGYAVIRRFARTDDR